MTLRCRIILVLLTLTSLPVAGQNNQDLQLWTSASVKTKISKDWSVVAKQGLRLSDNWSQLGTTFSELGITYKHNKHWSFKTAYRFGQPTNPGLPINHDHRYVIDIKYLEDYDLDIMDWDEIEVGLRLRYQSRYRDLFVSEDGLIPTTYLRGRLSFVLDMDRIIEPGFGTEWFYRLRYDGNFFDAYRIFIGFDWAIGANHTIELNLMRETEFNVNNPESINVLSISYTYKLKYLFEDDDRHHRTTRWL